MSSFHKLNPNYAPAFDGMTKAKALVQKPSLSQKILGAFLFGSAAENRHSANSDLDVLVLVSAREDIVYDSAICRKVH